MASGEIKRLIINVPPRSSKSSIVSVAFPAWTWCQPEKSGPVSGPHVQFLTSSYAGSLSMRDSVKTRRLLSSPWYQERWGDRFKLVGDSNTKTRYDNDKGGYRIATSVGGALTGEGGAVLIIDDPSNAMEVESDLMRQGVLDWYDNALSTRLNDPRTGAIILVMQRLHQSDLTGHLLEKGGDWEHLMLPMRYESSRHCVTGIGWSDPRSEDGELLMPERFGEDEVEELERALGPYGAAGQLQQRPSPAGGGILKRDWWMLWDDDAASEAGVPATAFPQVEYIVASLDTAYTEKKENDCSALVIMGLWYDKAENPKLIVMNAWAKRLELHGQTVERFPGETEADYIARSKPSWGLVEWVAHSCRRFRVDLLLIESTAAGIPVEQEIRRLHRQDGFGVRLIPPKGDKVARAYAAQSPLADGQIYAPDRAWADELITECENFPKGKHDDRVDAFTQGVKFFKDTGMLVRSQDRAADLEAAMLDYSQPKPIYEA